MNIITHKLGYEKFDKYCHYSIEDSDAPGVKLARGLKTTFAITAASPLTIGSVIIPAYEVLSENQNQLTAAQYAVTHTLFVNDNVSGTYQIAGGSVVWSTASTSGIVKLGVATGTTAPGSGTSQTSTGIDTSTTANTTNNFVLTTQTAIAAGSRVELVWSGTVTSLAGCAINVVLQRLS